MRRPEKYSFVREKSVTDIDLRCVKNFQDPFDWGGEVTALYRSVVEKRELNVRYSARMRNNLVFLRPIRVVSA